MIEWFLSVICWPTRNEWHAFFPLARHGTLTRRLGKFPSPSCIPPVLPNNPPTVISSCWPGGPILLAAGPALLPMSLGCHVWNVPLNGSYLFIRGATWVYRMFASQLTCIFSQSQHPVRVFVHLNPRESGPDMSEEGCCNLTTFTGCNRTSCIFSCFFGFVLAKEKTNKQQQTMLLCYPEKITGWLHKTEFIWWGANFEEL